MDFKLGGVAVVTGAAGEIGRTIAVALAANGASTVICADLTLQAAQEAADVVRSGGGSSSARTQALRFDVCDEGSVQDLVDESVRLAGRIDYFVNCAGTSDTVQKPLHERTLVEYETMDRRHNVGSFLCLRAAVIAMRAQEPQILPAGGIPGARSLEGRGAVVMMSSTAGEGSQAGIGAYAAAKHAQRALVETSGLEVARFGIRVNAVAPWFVATELVREFLEKTPALRDTMLGENPSRRLVEPAEIAQATCFLVSPASSYVNGYTLALDGGISKRRGTSGFDMNG